MSTPSPVTQISIILALSFTAWVVWLWIEKPTQNAPDKAIVMETTRRLAQDSPTTTPTTFVLPAPPSFTAPAPPLKSPPKKPLPKTVPHVEKDVPPAPAPPPVKKTIKPSLTPPKSPPPAPQAPTPSETANGRTLLRILEHGKGPQIEIAWPNSAQARNRLYQQFQSCFFMQNALMDKNGNLFRNEGPTGQRWEINLDRFSGFLRQASGQLPTAERKAMQAIARHHKNLASPVAVRVFPRQVDAALLGGLRAIIGESYMAAHTIQANYVLKGTGVLIQNILVDGKQKTGVIELSKIKSCRRGLS